MAGKAPYPDNPPPYGYPQVGYMPSQQVPQVVVTQQPTAQLQVSSVGAGPTSVYCTMCQRPVVTKVSYQNGSLTWLLCIIIFVLGGVFGCCLIPFCCASCQDVHHKCPNCKAGLGTYKRL